MFFLKTTVVFCKEMVTFLYQLEKVDTEKII